jgi:serine/threonine-protein kinase
MLGSPSYMSPEQFLGQAVDRRSDLFSAGIIFYEMLTGEKPFLGSSMSVIMHQVLKTAPIPPSELNVHAPPALDAVVDKALRKRPDERYQTAGEMLAAIRQATSEPAAAAHSVAAVVAAAKARVQPAARVSSSVVDKAQAAALEKTVVLNPQAPGAPADTRRGRSRMLWLAAAVLVAAIAGVLVLRPAVDSGSGTAATDTAPAKSAARLQEAVPAGGNPARPVPESERTARAPTPKRTGTSPGAAPEKREEQNSNSRRGFFGEEIKPSQWSKKDEGGPPW